MKVHEVTGRQCCWSSCLDVSEVYRLALSTSLAAERPVATQFVYEQSVHAQGQPAVWSSGEFAPARMDIAVRPTITMLDGTAASYCYTVRARPIVGGEPFVVAQRCVSNDLTGLGRVDRTPEEVEQWRAACAATPEAVDAGTLASDKADAAVDGDGEPLGPVEDGTIGREESGCQLAGSAAQAGGVVWWSLALLVFARRQRAT
jgi:hypothetical protein